MTRQNKKSNQTSKLTSQHYLIGGVAWVILYTFFAAIIDIGKLLTNFGAFTSGVNLWPVPFLIITSPLILGAISIGYSVVKSFDYKNQNIRYLAGVAIGSVTYIASLYIFFCIYFVTNF